MGAGALGGRGGSSGAQREEDGWLEGPSPKEPATRLRVAQEAEPERGWRRRCVSFVRVSALPRGRAQSSRYSKLEKADILEMTVRFLQELPASSCTAAAPSE